MYRKAAGLLAIAALVVAGWFSVLLVRADSEFRSGTLAGVARAIDLAPRNTAYLALRASQVEYNGGDSRPLLEEIARLNPLSAAPRIRLGLDAELRGDLPGAERLLLEAARVDRQYEPRWTLANFYFRHDDMEQFWNWMRSALAVSYGDRIPAFDLCERANADTLTILARAIPDQHEAVAAFLKYLLSGSVLNGNVPDPAPPPDIAPVAERLSHWRDPADLPVLSQEMDRLLIAGRRSEARQIWIDLGYPDPTSPLSNPDFGPPRIGHGFDWQLIPNPGVTHVSFETPPALRISFNGMQPESCDLLRQFPGVQTGKRYLLRWESRGVSSGLAWRIGADRAPLRAAENWTPGQLSFVAPRDSGALTLVYSRPLGEPRVEGLVELRHVTIEEQ